MSAYDVRRAPDYVRVRAPNVTLRDCHGDLWELLAASEAGAVLLLFPEPKTNHVPDWLPAASEAPWRTFVVVPKAPEHPVDTVLADPDGTVQWALNCAPGPAAVLVGTDKFIAGGPVYGVDAILRFVDELTEHFAGDQANRSPKSLDPGSPAGEVVGVFSPTYNRPDFARSLVLQMQNQTRRPDYLAIHQNGQAESYEWVIADIDTDISIEWIHTPHPIKQDDWYRIPLQALVGRGCSAFFWCDHDDLYYANHISQGLRSLSLGYDFSVNERCDLLLLKKAKFEVRSGIPFTPHDPGGQSSSMCFTRSFADALISDLAANQTLGYSDQVVERVTKPRFPSRIDRAQVTTAYVCHAEAFSSAMWLEQ